nr:MAG TPA: hypothetical protein [Caudoviricetes sp.]
MSLYYLFSLNSAIAEANSNAFCSIRSILISFIKY